MADPSGTCPDEFCKGTDVGPQSEFGANPVGGTRVSSIPPPPSVQSAQRPIGRRPTTRSRAAPYRPNRSGIPRVGTEGIAGHEGGSHGGHTLSTHVGRTDAQLRNRLRSTNRGEVSTFTSAPMASGVLTAATRENASLINRWLSNGGVGPLRITYTSPDIPIGRVMSSGNLTSRDAYSAVFYLDSRPNPHIQSDFSVITGWVH